MLAEGPGEEMVAEALRFNTLSILLDKSRMWAGRGGKHQKTLFILHYELDKL